MREYVQVLRAIWNCWRTGEKPAFEGEHYRFTLTSPNFTPEPIDTPPPAVMIAAVGPAMLRVAAQECDGVKHTKGQTRRRDRAHRARRLLCAAV
jgi:alkanesulfonate monooxygenase SsuD/methylene tetrahydromethanopterin reductase-like flavin-dependent oxidoreductase (luciferase family)